MLVVHRDCDRRFRCLHARTHDARAQVGQQRSASQDNNVRVTLIAALLWSCGLGAAATSDTTLLLPPSAPSPWSTWNRT